MPTMKYGRTEIESGKSINDIADELVYGEQTITAADLSGRHIGYKVGVETEIRDGWPVGIQGVVLGIEHVSGLVILSLCSGLNGGTGTFNVDPYSTVRVGGQFECD